MSDERPGDLAARYSDQIMTEHIQNLDEGQVATLNDQEVMIRDLKKSVFSKIQFKWRPDDERILEQIRGGVDTMFAEMFEDAFLIIDRFYEQMRVPEQNEDGAVVHDSAGRVIWKKDPRGREVEDWDQLTGQDIERTLLDITRLKLILAPQANELLLEAIFARHIFDDKLQESYSSLMEGTIGDRNAYAARESKMDKYHAFFRFYLYSHAEVFLKEVNNFARVLERIRYWRIDAQDGPTATGVRPRV